MVILSTGTSVPAQQAMPSAMADVDLVFACTHGHAQAEATALTHKLHELQQELSDGRAPFFLFFYRVLERADGPAPH